MEGVSEWLERHQIPIAIGLIVLIAIGGVTLLFEKQRDKLALAQKKPIVEAAAWEEERTELEERIAALETKVKTLEESKAVSQSAPQGQVAGARTSSSSATQAKSAVTGLVNINTADAAALDTLPGIGAVKAQAIIAYRQSHGGFKRTEDIKNVSGIGDSTFEKMKGLITVK